MAAKQSAELNKSMTIKGSRSTKRPKAQPTGWRRKRNQVLAEETQEGSEGSVKHKPRGRGRKHSTNEQSVEILESSKSKTAKDGHEEQSAAETSKSDDAPSRSEQTVKNSEKKAGPVRVRAKTASGRVGARRGRIRTKPVAKGSKAAVLKRNRQSRVSGVKKARQGRPRMK